MDKVALEILSLYGHEDNFDNSKASFIFFYFYPENLHTYTLMLLINLFRICYPKKIFHDKRWLMISFHYQWLIDSKLCINSILVFILLLVNFRHQNCWVYHIKMWEIHYWKWHMIWLNEIFYQERNIWRRRKNWFNQEKIQYHVILYHVWLTIHPYVKRYYYCYYFFFLDWEF